MVLPFCACYIPESLSNLRHLPDEATSLFQRLYCSIQCCRPSYQFSGLQHLYFDTLGGGFLQQAHSLGQKVHQKNGKLGTTAYKTNSNRTKGKKTGIIALQLLL